MTAAEHVPLRMLAVSQRFGRRTAVCNLTLECSAGTMTCLAGPNGAGKSTILAIAAGLLRPSSGRVILAQRDPADVAHPPAIGYVPQRSAFPGVLTAGEVFELARSTRRPTPEDSDDILDVTGIRAVFDRPLGELSGGWQRRLGLATALLPPSAALLLDEPFVGLDPDTLDRLLSHLRRRVDSGAIVLLATHEFELAGLLRPDLVVIDDGHLCARLAAPDGSLREHYRTALSGCDALEAEVSRDDR